MRPSFHSISLLCLLICLGVVTTGCPDSTGNTNNDDNNTVEMSADISNDATMDQSKDTPQDMKPVDMSADEGADMVVDQSGDMSADLSLDMEEDMPEDMVADMPTGMLSWSKVGLGCRSGDPYIALHFDGEIGYMGCGNAGSGEGLFMSMDGGVTWASQSAPGFSRARILDIRRGPDMKLYVAGKDSSSGNRAFIIDDSTVTMPKIQDLFIPMSTSAFRKVERAQNIAVSEDGQMFVDNTTGTQAAYKAANTTMWEELEAIGEESITGESSGVYQITKLRAFDNKFYAVGSTISTPASIRLPSKKAGAIYHFQTVQPVQTSTELRDFHVWPDGSMLAVGHDNDDRLAMLLYADKDPYVLNNWTRVMPSTSNINYKAGVNRIAVKGDLVIAVGERIPTAQGGFVWRSKDRGKTWEDITPSANGRRARRLWHVWMWDDGSLYVAGESEAWRLAR